MKRKHISWKTKCAACALALHPEMYDDAKNMTEDQFLSLFHWDHNMLHSSEHEDRDKFWNLKPLLIKAHREKTKQDAKVIAKGRRIRAIHDVFNEGRRIRREGHHLILSLEARQELQNGNPAGVLSEVFQEGMYEGRQEANASWVKEAKREGGVVRFVLFNEGLKRGAEMMAKQENPFLRKIKSRGFDKTRRKKMDGTVVKR